MVRPEADQESENGKRFAGLLLFPGENTAHHAGPLRVSHQAEGHRKQGKPLTVVSTGRNG